MSRLLRSPLLEETTHAILSYICERRLKVRHSLYTNKVLADNLIFVETVPLLNIQQF